MNEQWCVLNPLHLLEADRSFPGLSFCFGCVSFSDSVPSCSLARIPVAEDDGTPIYISSKYPHKYPWGLFKLLPNLIVPSGKLPCIGEQRGSWVHLLTESGVSVKIHIENTGIFCPTVNMHMTRAASLEFWF